MQGYFSAFHHNYKWPLVKNVDDPPHYTDDFSSDKGYFTEENGANVRRIENGVMKLESQEGLAITYLHIFEKNVRFKARVRFTAPNPPDAIFGLMLRYNDRDAFVRCGTFLKSGLFFIDSREGADLPCDRRALVPFSFNEGQWYDLDFTVDGTCAVMKIDGETVASVDGIAHNSPGRVAIYANRLNLEIDSVDAVFLSGLGTLWRGCAHNILPDEEYREGGSVIETLDGMLVYEDHRGASFRSTDNGVTWQRADKPWTKIYGYFQMLRLMNGDILKITTPVVDGVKYIGCERSSDDGATWTEGGIITTRMYKGTTNAHGGNMNDKLMQISSGRIFYPVSYECVPASKPVDGRIVFGEFYYSDDLGMTWQKSETDSWMIEGNEDQVKFGESKILECADGTLRLYNSWNFYDCVVYSESTDGGVTWGKLHKMPELACSISSMQFVRDLYADNDTTYYMVWVYSPAGPEQKSMVRSRLSLAKSTDGKNWAFLGDLWRWENNNGSPTSLAHVVDPFVKVTRDYVICGTGACARLPREGEKGGSHHAQRQHIWSIKKSDLKERPLPPV